MIKRIFWLIFMISALFLLIFFPLSGMMKNKVEVESFETWKLPLHRLIPNIPSGFNVVTQSTVPFFFKEKEEEEPEVRYYAEPIRDTSSGDNLYVPTISSQAGTPNGEIVSQGGNESNSDSDEFTRIILIYYLIIRIGFRIGQVFFSKSENSG